MTLTALAYMILEQIRSNKIVDDEEIDIRLIKDWIKLKRASLLKNKARYDINLNNLQKVEFGIDPIASEELLLNEADIDDDPIISTFISNSLSSYGIDITNLFVSTEDIPSILENVNGPIIYEISEKEYNTVPFQVIQYKRLPFSGNGKFSNNLVYGAYLMNKVLLRSNGTSQYLKLLSSDNSAELGEDTQRFKILAVFNDPTEIVNFNEDTSEYPCSLDIMEAIKNSIYDIEFKVYLNSKEDNINDDQDNQ